ncbi:MAG: methyltransferase domain-containing protein [Chitinophagaceae bacterium]
MNFAQRSYQKEILDREGIPAADIRLNMQELNFINTMLGGHKITLDGFRNFFSFGNNPEREIVVCEIGCGGGDNLYVIWKWCTRHGIRVKLIGIDINADCITVARERLREASADLIVSDYKTVDFGTPLPDVVFSSLFCHHFPEDELVDMLKWMKENSVRGFFINDLQRHPIAFYSISLLTRMFSSSYLVKNDAPLSVLRGFKSGEWKKLLTAAGLPGHFIQWKWAFRYLITVPVNLKVK